MAHKMKPVARERRASVAILNSKVDSAEDNPSHPAPQVFRAARPMPVELLHDGRGIYGIGVSDLFDHQAVAWRCGIEPQPWEHEYPAALILRPDRLDGTRPGGAVLQKIAGGFRHGMFSHTTEERLRQFIHHEALRRAGLSWPPRREPHDPPWWSANKKQQERNRCFYHGKRLLSLGVTNHLIGKALEEAANADAVKAARRFSFRHREAIYRAGALSLRALQLVDTFPVLALQIYAEDARSINEEFTADWASWEKSRADFADRRKYATDLIERGERLRNVAAVMHIPMALRCIGPGAAHLVSATFCQRPELLHFMPETLPRLRIWLQVVGWAHHRVDADFAEWTARHSPKISGNLNEVGSFLSDLADWVRGSATEGDELEAMGRRQFVVRPFVPTMSLKTVTRLSAGWHEAVASHMDGPQFGFPPPWYPAANCGAYEILPIDNSASLYREGAAMHHCVGSYADEVKRGGIYVYSIRRGGKPLATLALARNGRGASPIQLRGPCNAQPPKEIAAIVRRWLRAQKPLPPLDGQARAELAP